MSTNTPPSPELFFDTAQAYQRTAALRTAIDLDLFSAIGGGATTVPAIAAKCQASERGIRILCDYLTVIGFVTKSGNAYAQKNPQAEIVATDWAAVLKLASENAAKMGVAARHKGLPGDAFTVDWGGGYDIALMTNFLHHFDIPTCTTLLKKTAASLKP